MSASDASEADSTKVAPTLKLICKEGQTCDAYAELLSLASPLIADLVSVAASSAQKDGASGSGAGSKRPRDAGNGAPSKARGNLLSR